MIKEKIEELHWEEIAQQSENLKQKLRDMGIDLEKDPE